MNKMFISDTDGITSKIEFTYNPECDLFSNFDVHAQEYWSIPGWDSITGDPTAPIYSISNFGGSEVGGTFILTFKRMTATEYLSLLTKFKAGKDQMFRRYFTDNDYADYTVSIYRFPQEPISGTEVLNVKMELKILEVIKQYGD